MDQTRGPFLAIACVAVAVALACAALASFMVDEASADQLAPGSTFAIEELDGMPEGLETEAWPLNLDEFIIEFS